MDRLRLPPPPLTGSRKKLACSDIRRAGLRGLISNLSYGVTHEGMAIDAIRLSCIENDRAAVLPVGADAARGKTSAGLLVWPAIWLRVRWATEYLCGMGWGPAGGTRRQ